MTKRWWQSKTIRLNVLALVAAILDAALTGGNVLSQHPEEAVTVLAVGNALLRLVTRQPVR